MNTHADKTSENKSQAVANSLTKQQSNDKSTFVDNRPEAVAQRKLQEAIVNNPKVNSLNGQTIQLKPATAVGSTHLVQINNRSIMKGKEGEFVENGEELDVDPKTRVISRRGPNQELVGDYDVRGEHMYRWYKIDELDGHKIAGENKYIREKTFRFDNERHELPKAHDLERTPGKRTRQSHIAVRFEVWCNSDRKVDAAGHLVMADKSKEYRGLPPYHAYEMGDGAKSQGEPTEEPFRMGTENNAPELTGEENNRTGISVTDARDRAKRVPGAFKTLMEKQESAEELHTRLHGQKRFVSRATGAGFMQAQDGRDERPRFNKKKSVEMLVTIAEYHYLMRMWEARQEHGFYCFIREARTEAGYKYATRCLSSLEDIAVHRGQLGLEAGHAEDILNQFKVLNRITEKHTGEVSF